MTSKTLYCVLNWGLGHASRSIPLIKELMMQGHRVTIASDGLALELLKQAFPTLTFLSLPPYDITYEYDSITTNILSQSFKILRSVRKERKIVESMVNEFGFDTIVSDNRYGCYHSSCKSIFITHQLRLLHPNRFIQAAATTLNTNMIEKFDECWIPDDFPSKLSGMMSYKVEIDIPVKYIGPKSRFSHIPLVNHPKFKTVTILSGPEPQRSKLQEILKGQLEEMDGQHVMVTGKHNETSIEENILIKGLCNVDELTDLISQSEYIISRSGYSSIMDYEAMERDAILIPTPGQTEQEYLAEKLSSQRRHQTMNQDAIQLSRFIS